MLDAGVLLVGVLLRVLVGRVGGDLAGMSSVMSLCTRSVSVQGMLPNCSLKVLRMLRQPVELRLGLVAAAVGRHRLDLGILVRQRDLHRRLLLDAVAVHVDGFEDALGEVLLLRRRQLWDRGN